MDFVAEVVSLAPVVGYLTTAWKLFKLIRDSIDRVKESRQQFSFLAWTIAELLRVLNEGSEPGLSGLTSTSSTINNLQELLEEIHHFIEAEGHESFIKLLVTKDRRIVQIDAYQKKIVALADAFQISALLDVAKWQAKNDAAMVEDRNVLYARLDELERDRELLRKTLEAHQEGMAIMIAFQTRLQQQLDGDRERQFFSKSVAYLQTTTGRSVKVQDWMVSSFDVQFMRSIASGGFGEVLLGKWQQTEVALKVLKTVNGITPSSMVLETEINIWSKMRHPHILPFLGANVWGNRPFIVMPYLKNGNARDYIQNYPECNRAGILHQASLGLVYLHNMNIVHADLKGYNILIDDGRKAVLCDFGLSRVKTNINSQSIAAGDEEISGSINWMAPERLLGRSLRKPSDIYSFGMTIYEIFTDEVPLADVQRVAFTQLVAQGSLRPEKPSPDDGTPHLTDEIWAIAERCWAHAPSDRPLAKDICNSLEEMANPCISTSTSPLSGTSSQILGTLATPEAGPSSGKERSARKEQDNPVMLDDRADILPVTSVHVAREVAKEDERETTFRPGRRQEEKAFEDLVSNDLRGGSLTPGTSLTKPTLSSEKRQDGQGSPLANPISTSDRKGSAPMKAASSSEMDRTFVSDGVKKDKASMGSSYARPKSSTNSLKRSPMPAEPEYKLSPKDRVVIVMGPPGSGKTTFIKYAAQQHGETIGHSLQSRAIRTQHPFDRENVVFIDTPGFDDADWSDFEILSYIASWFVKVYKEKIRLSVIVYLHRISDNRMARSPLKNLQLFASMCGQAALPDVVLATTMWSVTPPNIGVQREQQLMRDYWADMVDKGCTVQRFRDSYESAWRLVGILPTENQNIIISREIHDDKKRLGETVAGVRLAEELKRVIADHIQSAGRLDEQAQMPDNVVLVAELIERKAEIEKKIGSATAQLQMLKIPLGRNIGRFFTGHKTRKSGIYVPPDAGRG